MPGQAQQWHLRRRQCRQQALPRRHALLLRGGVVLERCRPLQASWARQRGACWAVRRHCALPGMSPHTPAPQLLACTGPSQVQKGKLCGWALLDNVRRYMTGSSGQTLNTKLTMRQAGCRVFYPAASAVCINLPRLHSCTHPSTACLYSAPPTLVCHYSACALDTSMPQRCLNLSILPSSIHILAMQVHFLRLPCAEKQHAWLCLPCQRGVSIGASCHEVRKCLGSKLFGGVSMHEGTRGEVKQTQGQVEQTRSGHERN